MDKSSYLGAFGWDIKDLLHDVLTEGTNSTYMFGLCGSLVLFITMTQLRCLVC